jgi:hypothetical protein
VVPDDATGVCIYCGGDSGPYDEHEECVNAAMENAVPDPPACICGQAMRFDDTTETWACPRTLDDSGWGRPKKGHVHYYPDEDFRDGRRPIAT